MTPKIWALSGNIYCKREAIHSDQRLRRKREKMGSGHHRSFIDWPMSTQVNSKNNQFRFG